MILKNQQVIDVYIQDSLEQVVQKMFSFLDGGRRNTK